MSKTLEGKMTLVDMSGVSIWNGEREVHDESLKDRIRRKSAKVSVKAEFPKEHLRPFSRYKMRIRRTLEEEGFPFMSGFAIPADRTRHVMDVVNTHIDEAQKAREHFLDNYDGWRQKLLDEADDQEWRDILDQSMLSAEQVEKKIQFEVTPLNVTISPDDPEGLSRKLNGLHEEIVGSAVKFAQEFLEKNQNPEAMRTSSTKKLKELRHKLNGFKWLHGVDSAAICTLLDHAIQAAMNCTDKTLPEQVYWQVVGPVAVIADPGRLQRYLDGEIQLSQIQSGPTKITDSSQPIEKEPDVSISDDGFDFGLDEPAEPDSPAEKDSKVIDFDNFDDFPKEDESQEIPDFDEASGFSF